MLNKIFYALVACITLAACSSSYRTTQTPDDVYYSPGKHRAAVSVEESQDDYQTYDDADDNYLRMKVGNHNRWSSLDDYSYWNVNPYYSNYYSPYALNYGGYYSPFSSFSYYPSFYSPLSLSFFYSPYSSYNYYNSWGLYRPNINYVYYKNSSGMYGRPQNRTTLNGYTNRNYNYGNSQLPVRSGRRFGVVVNGNNTYNSYGSSGNRSADNTNRSYNNSNGNVNVNRNNNNVNRSYNNNSNPVRTFNNNSGFNNSGTRSSSSFSTGGTSVSRPVRH